MSVTTGEHASRRAPRSRSFRIGQSEIRPLRGAPEGGERDGRERTGRFIPGGSYRLEKFPALARLLHEWEGGT